MPESTITIIQPDDPCPDTLRQRLADFLYQHLDEFGDPRKDILLAIDYARGANDRYGGTLIYAEESSEIAGAVVLNETGMHGYIPENILVYIAVHQKARGQGLGRQLMNAAINATKGNIALHVEADNPARFLYEKVGFTNPYLEMRLDKAKLQES